MAGSPVARSSTNWAARTERTSSYPFSCSISASVGSRPAAATAASSPCAASILLPARRRDAAAAECGRERLPFELRGRLKDDRLAVEWLAEAADMSSCTCCVLCSG